MDNDLEYFVFYELLIWIALFAIFNSTYGGIDAFIKTNEGIVVLNLCLLLYNIIKAKSYG